MVGDYVQIKARRSPYRDDPSWFWRVTAVYQYGFDAVYERALIARDGNRVEAFRNGVAYKDVRGHRRPNEAELS